MSDTAVLERRTVTNRVGNVVFYSDGSILVKGCRLSYPHLDEPWAGKNEDGTPGKPRYSATGLVPKIPENRPGIMALRDRINEVAAEAKLTVAKNRRFLSDGDDSGKPEYAGHWQINAAEQPKNPPVLRDRGRDSRTGKAKRVERSKAAEVFYPGCWVNLLIRPWPQPSHGKRINANLLAVQKVRDDEAFGQGRISEDDIDDTFEPIDDDDSGYDEDALGEDQFDL